MPYRLLTPFLWLTLGPQLRAARALLINGPTMDVSVKGVHFVASVQPEVANTVRDLLQRGDESVASRVADALAPGVIVGARALRAKVFDDRWYVRPLQLEALKALGAGDIDGLRQLLLRSIRIDSSPIPDQGALEYGCALTAMQALSRLLEGGADGFSRAELTEIIMRSRDAATADSVVPILDAVSPRLNHVIAKHLLTTREEIRFEVWRSTHAWYRQRGIKDPPLVEILCDAVRTRNRPVVFAALEALLTHHADELPSLPTQRFEGILEAALAHDNPSIHTRVYEALGPRSIDTVIATLRRQKSTEFATQYVAFDWVRRNLSDDALSERWKSSLFPWAWMVLKRPGGGGAQWRELYQYVCSRTPPGTVARFAYNDLKSGEVDLAGASDIVAEAWPRALAGLPDAKRRAELMGPLLQSAPNRVTQTIVEVMCADSDGRLALERGFFSIASSGTINALAQFAGEHDPEMVERVLLDVAFDDDANGREEAIRKLGDVGSVNAAARLRTLADEARGRGAAATRREAGRAALRIQERLSLSGGGLAIAEDHGGALAISDIDGGAVAIAPGDPNRPVE